MSDKHREHTHNPLAVYATYPENVAFDTQEKGEEIILLLRQHLATQVTAILEIIFLILTPFLISPILVLTRIELPTLTPGELFLIILFWYLFVFGFSFYKFIFWYFNVYLLTNERVIDYDFKGILHKETAYANLNQIQDVSPKIIGFFGTFFHFGHVFIQTAAEKPEFEFHSVARPDDVAQKILEQVRIEEAEAPGVIA